MTLVPIEVLRNDTKTVATAKSKLNAKQREAWNRIVRLLKVLATAGDGGELLSRVRDLAYGHKLAPTVITGVQHGACTHCDCLRSIVTEAEKQGIKIATVFAKEE